MVYFEKNIQTQNNVVFLKYDTIQVNSFVKDLFVSIFISRSSGKKLKIYTKELTCGE